MASQKLIPYKGLDLDTSPSWFRPEFARFIKNLVYVVTDSSQVAANSNGNTGVYKPYESNGQFDISFVLPNGENQCVGYYSSRETGQVFFLNWNSNENHGLYVIDAFSQTVQKVYAKECLRLSRKPEYFLHEGGATLEIFDFTDPDTGLPRRRSYFVYTDGNEYQKYICVEDSIATDSFNESAYPFFDSEWEACDFINCGVPKPDCPSITEVANDDPTKPNFLKFNTWQFRIEYIDVYGRTSGWGKISDLYISGDIDCISSSELLPRCLDITFNAGSPFIDKINFAFRNCNENAWNLDTTLFLYKGSCLGDWWKRERNPDINYNPETNYITYRFCKDKECSPIDQAETDRTENPMPRQSQSLAKIGNVIGMANNKEKFNPVNLEGVSVEVVRPSGIDGGTANIEIYVPVINVFTQQYQPIYQTESGRWVFGGRYTSENQYVAGVDTLYNQKFGSDEQKGFIGYLAATGTTPNSTISELYYVDDSNNFVKVEDYAIVYNPPYTQRKWYNKFTFSSVAKGKYLFRIASHLAKTTDVGFHNTSTFVFGQFSWANKETVFNASQPSNFGAISLTKEIEIDVCSGDYSSLNDSKVLAIFDLTHPGTTGAQANKALSGYVHERNNAITNDPENPVELLLVLANKGGNQAYVTSRNTDHNGFYFAADGSNNYFCEIFGNCGCNNYKKLISFGSGSTAGNVSQNWTIQGRTECLDFADKLCARVLIKGKITLCGSDVPVPNVGVVYSRGRTSITGADGTFTIIAHVDNTAPQKTRNDYVYFVPTLCPFTSCDGMCLDVAAVVIPPCSECVERTFDIGLKQVRFDTKRGLLSGGKYGVAIELEDWLGRHTYAQTKDDFYKVLPTITDTRSFNPSSLSLSIDPSVTFPTYFKKLNILITKELSLEDYITWIVDKIEFVDNTGKVNNEAPTQIKIYYGSLVEYNSKNNFNTTTGWQFADTQLTPAVNYTSDYVEFYVNGDGQFFTTLIRSLIKYDQTGQYFLIEYDTALKDLKPYAQVRLCRPTQCSSDNLFFCLCGTVDIINGKPILNSIPINAYDTYYKYRQIPVPISTGDDNTDNIPVTLGIPFEHHSPSDFWGYRCTNIGHPNARNPYECEIIKQNEIALSGALSENGQLNYLNYFDNTQKENFDSWDFQGIVSMIWQTAVGLIICRNNCFTIGYNDNIVRVNQDGQMIVPSAADKFGKPTVKVGNNFGCSLYDKNTIRSWQGLVHWVDTSEGVAVQHDYNDALIISQKNAKIEAGIDSWLRPKIAYIKRYNNEHGNTIYWVGGIDPASKGYYITARIIGEENFVNNEREISTELQETILFDIYNKIWRNFASFVPEMYAYLQSNTLNQQFFGFANGVPYKFYTDNESKTYNTFFGVKCSRVLRVIGVADAFQKKKWQNISLISKTLYFSDKITTDANQETRMLKAMWKKGDFYYSAAIPANILTVSDPNTPFRNSNKLYEGDLMYGSWIDIRMIGDPELDDKYTELYGLILDLQPQEKLLGGGSASPQ